MSKPTCEVCGGVLVHLTPDGDPRGENTRVAKLEAERDEARQWVHDLQSGMYINCVYCGHRYGPEQEVDSTMQEALYQHVRECTKHPLSKAEVEVLRLRAALTDIKKNGGVVCPNFALCEHESCHSSYAAWQIAEAALAAGEGKEEPK